MGERASRTLNWITIHFEAAKEACIEAGKEKKKRSIHRIGWNRSTGSKKDALDTTMGLSLPIEVKITLRTTGKPEPLFPFGNGVLFRRGAYGYPILPVSQATSYHHRMGSSRRQGYENNRRNRYNKFF